MPVNDFKAFATGEFANVLSQPEFEALETLGNGFQSGIARSEELNKVWRQASTIASVVASFMATKSGNDVLDNGDVTTLQATLLKALLNNSTSQLDGRYLKAASNLSELSNTATARVNLGLKGAAVQDTGTVAGTVAAGNDARIVNALQRGNNLSELTDKAAARANLELKSGALRDVQISKDDITAGKLLSNGCALALRSVRAIAGATGNDVSNTNILPNNSVSFVYSTATNSPGITGSLLDYCGLNGSYNTQIVAAYSNGGNSIKFRTYNGDAAKAWNPWFEFYHTGNKPTAKDTGAFPTAKTNLTVNLNTLGGTNVGEGFYYQTTSALATPALNYPILEAGTLMVTTSAYGCQQEYTTYGTGRKFQRGLVGGWNGNGPWSVWKEYFSTNNIPTAAEVGAYTKAEGDARYILFDGASYAGFASGNAASPYMRHKASNTVVGLARAVDVYSKAASDGRYITGMRLGTQGSAVLGSPNPFRAPAGCVMTGWLTEGQNPGGDTIYYKPLQILLNGAWVTIKG